MLGVSHATLGATGGLVAGVAIEAPLTMKCVMMAVGAFGGLLSDGDTESSFVGRLLPKLWHRFTPGHRRITHSLFYSGGVLLVAWLIQLWGAHAGVWSNPAKPYVPLALTAGMLTHLLADGLTEEGVPLFYPLWKRRFRLLGPFSFTTGTATERVVVTVLMSLAGGYIFRPLAKHLTGSWLHTPAVAGVHTEPLVVFVATVLLCGLLLVLYSLSRSGKPRRRRRSQPHSSGRRPVRARTRTRT